MTGAVAFKPHGYQKFCISKILRFPYCGLFIEMGLGKTVVTLTALHELKYNRFQIRKALIIAPKKVAEATWAAEAAKWDHLSQLRLSHVLGTRAQREAALERTADIYIINRENTKWLVDYYNKGLSWPFDVVVLDESTSFKSHRSERFKALRKVRPAIKRLILLTGTPAPHGVEDLWSQVYLLDGGQRLGRTISAFRDIYETPDQRSRTQIFSYRPKPGAEQQIYDQISDICVSMRAVDYLTMPELIYHDIPVKLDAAAQRAYTQMERDMLLPISEEELAVAQTAGVLTGKLLQLCNGAIYTQSPDQMLAPAPQTPVASEVHQCKLDALMETIEALQGQHALLFYQFRHDIDRVMARLGTVPSLRVRLYTGPRDADAWNAGEIDVLLAHPASCGYGLNLQQGGHHIIWFGLTWALEQYQQANARLYRQGQEHPVIVHRLVVQGGMDEDVLAALEDKRGTQDALIDALRARIERAQEE